MDCGGHKLYIPGPGDIQIILPPGSKEIPLRKDCSGHLVMIVDDYERVVHKKGGVPEPPLQMRADSAGSSAGQPSSASGNANAETTQVAEIIRFQSADKDLVGRYYVLRLIGRGNRQIAQWEANFDDGDAGPRLSHRRVGDKFPDSTLLVLFVQEPRSWATVNEPVTYHPQLREERRPPEMDFPL
jgi:hypothetical protein